MKRLPLFPDFWNPDLFDALERKREPGGDEMDDGAELATMGLVAAFAAVLLVVSHVFIQAQSAKQLVRGSMELRAKTNVVAIGL